MLRQNESEDDWRERPIYTGYIVPFRPDRIGDAALDMFCSAIGASGSGKEPGLMMSQRLSSRAVTLRGPSDMDERGVPSESSESVCLSD